MEQPVQKFPRIDSEAQQTSAPVEHSVQYPNQFPSMNAGHYLPIHPSGSLTSNQIQLHHSLSGPSGLPAQG